MTKYLPFLLDNEQFVTNQKCFIITGHHIAYLTAFFNSSLFKFCYKDSFPKLGDEGRELSKIFFNELIVADIDDEQNDIFLHYILKIQQLPKGKERLNLEIEVDKLIFKIYGLLDEEISQIGFIEIE